MAISPQKFASIIIKHHIEFFDSNERIKNELFDFIKTISLFRTLCYFFPFFDVEATVVTFHFPSIFSQTSSQAKIV